MADTPVTLRPDATVNPALGTIGGGAASRHAAVSDNSDTTYVTLPKGGGYQYFGLGTTTKPAGSVVKAITTRVRVASSTSNPSRVNFNTVVGNAAVSKGVIWLGDDTVVDRSGHTEFPGDLTQAQIDALRVRVACPSIAWDPVNVYEVYVDVVFQEASTVTIDALGTQTSSTVTTTFTHTPGANGGGQHARRIKLFTAEQADTFADADEAWLAPAVRDSGIEYTADGAYTFEGLEEGSYVEYVWTAQKFYWSNHWGDPDTEDFDVDLTPVELDSLTIGVYDAERGAFEGVVQFSDALDHIEVERTATPNLLPSGMGRFESGSDGIGAGWAEFSQGGLTNEALTLASSSGWDGQYQRIQGERSSGLAAYGIVDGSFRPVTPNTGYVLTMMVKRTFTGSFVGHYQAVDWYDAAENLISTSSLGHLDDLAAWTLESVPMFSPSNARFAKVRIFGGVSVGTGSWDIHVDNVRLAASEGAWVPVRGVTELTPGAGALTFIDWEAPPDLAVTYRARAVEANGNVGPWIYATTPVEWSFAEGVWLKSISDPAQSVKLRLGAPPDPVEPARRGVFPISGSSKPVAIHDERLARQLPFSVRTNDADESAALRNLIRNNDVILVQFPAAIDFESGYFSVGNLEEHHMTRYGAFPYRDWVLADAIEVEAP